MSNFESTPYYAGPYAYDLDPEWQSRLEMRRQAFFIETPGLNILEDKLRSIAGGTLCPMPENDLDDILERGVVFDGNNAIEKTGRRGACHQNSILLWNKDPHNVRIATGYALSADGLWRQHSWCVTSNNKTLPVDHLDVISSDLWRVIETTTPRVCYFGFILSSEESFQLMETYFG